MPQRLLIRLHTDGSYTWLAQGDDGRALSGAQVGLPAAAALAEAGRVVVLVPAADVLLLDAPALSRQRAQLAKAVPFAIEEQLAQPVEDLHFALAAAVGGERIGVAVVARTTMQRWLGALHDAGVRADAMLPDSLALPVGGMLVERHHATLRFAPYRAAGLELAMVPEWLALCGEGVLPALEVFDTREAPRLALPVPTAAYHERRRDPLVLLASGVVADPAINLLQGEFAAGHRQAPVARWWRIAAMLAGAALLLGFGHALFERSVLARESDRLDATMRDLLDENFPEMDKVAGEPAALMRSAMQRLGGGQVGGGALHLLSQVAPIIGGTTRITTRGIEFRNGTLELALTAPDVPTLDSVRERLATVPGLKVEVTAANPTANGVDGRLRIAGASR
jgi:general secretion pathway protein L